jgi:hypothetical protein
MNRPSPKPTARSYYGTPKAWERVRDKGRVVSSIIGDRIDQERYDGTELTVRVIKQSNGARVIQVTGSFDQKAADRFSRTVRKLGNGRPDWVAFDTLGGGRYEVAKAIGREIREKGLNTMVAETDVCGGACLIAFVGGIERRTSDLPYIGGGQFEILGIDQLNKREAVDATQVGIEQLFAYFREMGADPTIVEPMLQRYDDHHYRFSAAELKRANVATKVER